MSSAEGAALRVQLDALWGVLAPLEQAARGTGDGAVMRLLEGVQAARQAAITVERRIPAARTYRGITLAKH